VILEFASDEGEPIERRIVFPQGVIDSHVLLLERILKGNVGGGGIAASRGEAKTDFVFAPTP